MYHEKRNCSRVVLFCLCFGVEVMRVGEVETRSSGGSQVGGSSWKEGDHWTVRIGRKRKLCERLRVSGSRKGERWERREGVNDQSL